MRLAEEEAKVHENETKIAVMTMLKEGSVPEDLPTPGRVSDICEVCPGQSTSRIFFSNPVSFCSNTKLE